MWPKYISMAVYSIFEAGYEAVLYGILVFYLTAGFITIIIVLFERFKQRRIQNFDEEDEETLKTIILSENESIHLVPQIKTKIKRFKLTLSVFEKILS